MTDVHLGVISTSLGDAGANVACPPVGFPRYVAERVDNAHLLGALPRGQRYIHCVGDATLRLVERLSSAGSHLPTSF